MHSAESGHIIILPSNCGEIPKLSSNIAVPSDLNTPAHPHSFLLIPFATQPSFTCQTKRHLQPFQSITSFSLLLSHPTKPTLTQPQSQQPIMPLSNRQLEYLALAWQCFETEPKVPPPPQLPFPSLLTPLPPRSTTKNSKPSPTYPPPIPPANSCA